MTPPTSDPGDPGVVGGARSAHPVSGVPEEVALEAGRILAPGQDPASLVARPVSGGCIHPAVHLSPATGNRGGNPRREGRPREGFLKWGPPDTATFPVEAEGLRALARRGGVRIPEVLGVGDRWLLLEYLPPAPPAPDSGRRLGSGLARLHRRLEVVGGPEDPDAGGPGWSGDGWIGTLPQVNTWAEPNPGGPDRWSGFWRDLRLAPQMAMADAHLPAPVRRVLERLLDRMEEALEGWDVDGLSLLHGDLWSGNALVTLGGEPALVDPAVYRGHREVDLAMMELFGGFGREVFRAYRELRPLQPGYPELRRPLYQLYPLLVHLNLFGTGYLPGVEAAAKRVLAELG